MDYLECLNYYKKYTLNELYIAQKEIYDKLQIDEFNKCEEIHNEYYILDELIYKKTSAMFDNEYKKYNSIKFRNKLIRFILNLNKKYQLNEKDDYIDHLIKNNLKFAEKEYLLNIIQELDNKVFYKKYKAYNVEQLEETIKKQVSIIDSAYEKLESILEKFGINSEEYITQYGIYLNQFNELTYLKYQII